MTLALLATPAFALWGDRIEVFAGQNASYDSNVFRISDRRDPQSTIGAPSFSDRYYTTMVGFTAAIPVSLQRFEASAVWNHTRYDRFSDLNFNGHNARAAWIYAVEDVLSGEVSATETKGLSTFSNIQGRVPDFVTSRTFLANTAWMVTPRIRLHGALTASEQEHTATVRQVQDLERRSVEGGVSYVTPAANRIGVAVRAERGELPTETVFAGIPFDNSYDQLGYGLIGRYQVTGLSTLDARVEYIKREYDQLPRRNYSGPTFSLAWTYAPTAKTSFVTTAIRDIGPLEDINTSFVLVTGISVKPKWNATEKITVQGNAEYSEWDYRGDPLVGANWKNKVRTVGLGVAWRPLQRVMFQAAVSREKRTSTLPFNDYVVDLVTIEGRIGF